MQKQLFALSTLTVCLLAPALASAAPAPQSGPHDSWYAIAMGLGMGLAAFGGGMGQGRAASAALEGICRNPNAVDKVFTPMLLSLAFIESLVIFTLVIAAMIYAKFGF